MTDSGRVSRQEDFVFFGNLKHPSESVQHMGDNLTGAGEGDDEQIKIDLSKVPENITKIAFTVTIYEPEKGGRTSDRSTMPLSASIMKKPVKRCCAMT